MEFEALLSPQSQSPKRRRCAPLPGSPGGHSPQRCGLISHGEEQSQGTPPPLPFVGERRLTPEQIFENIKQEYSRYQRRRQLEGAFNLSEACPSNEVQTHCSSLAAPSSPGTSVKKDQPSFTLRQVGILCERLLKDHDEKIREEYEQILNLKLAEQYDSFVKFTHDQIMRRYGARPASYVSWSRLTCLGYHPLTSRQQLLYIFANWCHIFIQPLCLGKPLLVYFHFGKNPHSWLSSWHKKIYFSARSISDCTLPCHFNPEEAFSAAAYIILQLVSLNKWNFTFLHDTIPEEIISFLFIRFVYFIWGFLVPRFDALQLCLVTLNPEDDSWWRFVFEWWKLTDFTFFLNMYIYFFISFRHSILILFVVRLYWGGA